MNRLVVWREECDEQGRVVLTDRRAEHIRTVLKCEVGDTLRAGFANEGIATGTVVSIDEGRCVVELRENSDEVSPTTLPPPPMIDLILALPRPRFLERILPQLPPLGVRKIFLCGADRVEKSFFGSQLLKKENYLPVLVEGVEQGGGIVVPEVRVERSLRRLLQEVKDGYGCKLVAHPGEMSHSHGWKLDVPVMEEERSTSNVQHSTSNEEKPPRPRGNAPLGTPPQEGNLMLVAIGCEGGWTDRELAWMEEAGFARFSLGERVLRTDTACVAVLAVINYLFLTQRYTERPSGVTQRRNLNLN